MGKNSSVTFPSLGRSLTGKAGWAEEGGGIQAGIQEEGGCKNGDTVRSVSHRAGNCVFSLVRTCLAIHPHICQAIRPPDKMLVEHLLQASFLAKEIRKMVVSAGKDAKIPCFKILCPMGAVSPISCPCLST